MPDLYIVWASPFASLCFQRRCRHRKQQRDLLLSQVFLSAYPFHLANNLSDRLEGFLQGVGNGLFKVDLLIVDGNFLGIFIKQPPPSKNNCKLLD